MQNKRFSALLIRCSFEASKAQGCNGQKGERLSVAQSSAFKKRKVKAHNRAKSNLPGAVQDDARACPWPCCFTRPYWHRLLLDTLCLLPFFMASLSFSGEARAADTLVRLQAGEVRVLTLPDVARVAVGDGQVINAVTTEEKEVIVFARKEGSSNLQIWSSDGVRYRYQIEVAPEGSRRIQQELRDVLERIPNARVSLVGDKLLVEGDELGDDDRERIADLSRRYPQLLDFTSQVGWDRMVLLDVRVVEVPRNQLQELGVRWSPQSAGGLTTGLAWDGGSKRLLDRPAVGQETAPMPLLYPSGAAAAYFGINALLSAQITAMAQSGSAVILAQPQLLARSGSTAEFLAGGEVPYSTVDSNGNSSTSFKPYGVSLRITPKIERNNTLRSRIEVEVSSIDAALSVPNGPSLKTRRASTEFNVRSGQTLVLAGFLSREESRNVHKVPGLGDLPLLGRLFSSTRYQNAETELAIFVTPVVVTADHPDLLERVARSEAILESTFKNPEVLNVPVHFSLADGVLAQQTEADVLPLPESRRRLPADPRDVAGSQWVTHSIDFAPSSAEITREAGHAVMQP